MVRAAAKTNRWCSGWVKAAACVNFLNEDEAAIPIKANGPVQALGCSDWSTASLKGEDAARLDSDSPFGASDRIACLGGSYEELMYFFEHRFRLFDLDGASSPSTPWFATVGLSCF